MSTPPFLAKLSMMACSGGRVITLSLLILYFCWISLCSKALSSTGFRMLNKKLILISSRLILFCVNYSRENFLYYKVNCHTSLFWTELHLMNRSIPVFLGFQSSGSNLSGSFDMSMSDLFCRITPRKGAPSAGWSSRRALPNNSDFRKKILDLVRRQAASAPGFVCLPCLWNLVAAEFWSHSRARPAGLSGYLVQYCRRRP